MNLVVKVVGGENLGETSGKWKCRDARNVPGSDVGLLRVWILSVRGANCSTEDRSEFVVFSEGFKLKSVAFVLAPLIPLLFCMRKDFRGLGVGVA